MSNPRTRHSVRLAFWNGVEVRWHYSALIYPLAMVWLCLPMGWIERIAMACPGPYGQPITAFLCGLSEFAILVLPILLLHELAHAAAFRLCGTPTASVVILPFLGLTHCRTADCLSPQASLFAVAAGPAVNVLIGCSAFILPAQAPFGSLIQVWPWLITFLVLNLYIGLFNLTPMFPLDGGRIVYFLLRTCRLPEGLSVTAAVLSVVPVAAGLVWVAGKWGIFFLVDLGLVIVLFAVIVSYDVIVAAWHRIAGRIRP